MSDATNLEILAALVDQLEEKLAPIVDGLQVVPRRDFAPTPPCIDVYPGDPFGEQIAFATAERELLFTIRARVTAADNDAGQDELLGLMDRNGGSLIGAVAADPTLGDVVDYALAEGPSGFTLYQDVGGSNTPVLLGCEWRLRVGV